MHSKYISIIPCITFSTAHKLVFISKVLHNFCTIPSVENIEIQKYVSTIDVINSLKYVLRYYAESYCYKVNFLFYPIFYNYMLIDFGISCKQKICLTLLQIIYPRSFTFITGLFNLYSRQLKLKVLATHRPSLR